MNRYARVIDGVAVEVWDATDFAPHPSTVFVAELAAQFIECPSNVIAGALYDGISKWTPPLVDNVAAELSAAKAARIELIKQEAADRIAATDWRLERARERAALGEQNLETEADVLAEREQIRQASNAAEAAVIALTTVEQVKTFSW